MVKINNKPTYADNYEWIVAYVSYGEYWFYGAYTNGYVANKVACEMDGELIYNEDYKGERTFA